MKGKAIFTREEASQIMTLIRKKLVADQQNQKKIRQQIRNLGFYASDFDIGGGYTDADFRHVVKIEGDSSKPGEKVIKQALKALSPVTPNCKRAKSDEAYVLDLCDEILGIEGKRQHRFDFLKGDAGTRLPVDCFYPSINLVIEYREKQHTEKVEFFDKRKTVSGVRRGDQRKKYDQLRRTLLPKHDIRLIEIGYYDFEHTSQKRLLRKRENDSRVIKALLTKYS